MVRGCDPFWLRLGVRTEDVISNICPEIFAGQKDGKGISRPPGTNIQSDAVEVEVWASRPVYVPPWRSQVANGLETVQTTV